MSLLLKLIGGLCFLMAVPAISCTKAQPAAATLPVEPAVNINLAPNTTKTITITIRNHFALGFPAESVALLAVPAL